jgi:hypothetical protein
MANDLSASAPTTFVNSGGVRFAYRRAGRSNGFPLLLPLLLPQHFTGTMDSWDPSVGDGLALARPVVVFDNAGVGRPGGATPDTVSAMADHALEFVAALGLTRVDLAPTRSRT